MTPYRPLIQTIAASHGLDPFFVEAIVMVESSGNADAFRYEAHYFDAQDLQQPPYKDQILRRISSSYGLMQVMFPTAVDHDFVGEPEELFKPAIGLEHGCRVLATLVTWAGGDLRKAAAAYNGGKGGWNRPAPQQYAAEAIAIYVALKAAA